MGEPHQPRPTRITSATSLALVIGLSACSQVPALKVPEVPVAAAWHEPSPSVVAEPRRVLPSGAWWTIYGDSELDTLQQRLLADSPDLAAALARYQQARAASDLLRASQSPTLGGWLNLQRNRQSENRPLRVLGPNSPDYYNSATLGLELEYEVDVWGRVRALVAGGEAQRLAAQADLAAARLSLQASLAETLIVLRGLDRDVELLGEAQTAYARALDLVRRRHEGGASSGLDLARAQAQLEATRSQLRQSLAQRALVEHAIAALLGQSPSEFTIAPGSAALQTAMSETGRARSGTPQTGTPQTGTPQTRTERSGTERSGRGRSGTAQSEVSPSPEAPATPSSGSPGRGLPFVPVGVPSTLLQRRPDIVAAQQRVAAANASVGVARTAWFPSLMLSSQAGYQSSDFGHFLGAPNLFWAIGSTLLVNVFDGGRRQADEARVRAVLDEVGARYRAVVLAAFQQVEDSLALLDRFGSAVKDEQAAVEAAQRALTIATNRYQQGAVSYLEVITAQTTSLQAQRSAADLATRERRASVQLVRALGGGWDQAALASPEAPTRAVSQR